MFGKRRKIIFENRHEIVVGMLKMHAKIAVSSQIKSRPFYEITAIRAWKEKGGRRNEYRWRKKMVSYCSGWDPDIVVMRAAKRRIGEWHRRRPLPRHPWFWAMLLSVMALAVAKITWRRIRRGRWWEMMEGRQ